MFSPPQLPTKLLEETLQSACQVPSNGTLASLEAQDSCLFCPLVLPPHTHPLFLSELGYQRVHGSTWEASAPGPTTQAWGEVTRSAHPLEGVVLGTA